MSDNKQYQPKFNQQAYICGYLGPKDADPHKAGHLSGYLDGMKFAKAVADKQNNGSNK